VRERFLDVLPGRRVYEPAIYWLSPKARRGWALLTETVGETAARKLRSRPRSVPHLLGINDVRIRVEKGCEQLGFQLRFWLRSEDLISYMPRELVPDAYWQIQREVAGELKVAGFFLELQ
jgi:hypothetical protein